MGFRRFRVLNLGLGVSDLETLVAGLVVKGRAYRAWGRGRNVGLGVRGFRAV